ncbi:rhomboid family intramembrane serine protease [Planosporangium mesophilum]|uniref:Rhomboid family intramembrane serine protease n=1 Tax=Planosporangium mesophilum TaxID=689768 RepID=A0A8J3WZL7_9ACTN|nr:rhomboid family intramembrane serine protease [Planosporangium mesophilum]NJC82304.1 rhomboid family intramembrane serine protease [Planosporangium mesophilum]GII22357.1 rhomboid family intramembrane serine protease [Planosporangium mesophilum]
MTQPPSVGVPACYRHPSRETYVRCNRCDRPICPDCMREASVGHQCPECVTEGRRTQPSVRTAFGGTAAGHRGTVTKVLIAINVAVMLIGVLLSGTGALLGRGLFTGSSLVHYVGAVVGPNVVLQSAGGSQTFPGIDNGGWYRLITAMFIHYGLLHLLMNMWGLWILGRQLEAVLGRGRFLALYLLAGLGGNVAAYLFSPDALSAGASTAIFGLFAAYAIIVRRLGGSLAGILPILAINLYITFFFPGISKAGHLGGLVVGAIVAAGLAYAPRGARTRVQVAVLAGVLALLGFLTLLGPSLHA